MKHITILFILIFINTTVCLVRGQDKIFRNNGTYKYQIGNSSIPNDWNTINFNDNTWNTGNKSIGYGDNDDSTIIAPTPSVYMRIKFNIADKNNVKEAKLMADYDDGFIAYLNGNEVIRVNMGNKGDFINYNTVATRSHEAFNYRTISNSINGYYLDSITLDKYLLNGENTLAIEVHNDSTNGSDLSFNCSLYNLNNEYFNVFADESAYIGQTRLDSSKFPIIVINTDEYGIPYSHKEVKAKMGVIYHPGLYNKPTDLYNNYDGNISIEIRGQSSSNFPKKPYNIETQDKDGFNNNVSLLGLPKENDWILLCLYADKSLIRNDVVMTMARRFGRYQPRTRFCELILNGEYLGLYSLTEKIKRDTNRVNISALNPDEITGDDVTGGYIFKHDKPTSTDLQIVYPDHDNLPNDQYYYLSNYLASFYASLNKPTLADPDMGYKHYIDSESLIDFILVNELTKNCDAYLFSTFLHKDKASKGGKLIYGPFWDNDLAMGGATFQNGHLTHGWQFEENTTLQITKILADPEFAKRYSQKWKACRKTFFHTDSIMNLIDSLANYIHDARVRNFKVWPIQKYDLFSPFFITRSYEEDISSMKYWIKERVKWIDDHIDSIYYPLPLTIPSAVADNDNLVIPYPNPFSNSLSFKLSQSLNTNYSVELCDLTGRLIYKNSTFNKGHNLQIPANVINSMKPGMYVFRLVNKGNTLAQVKVIKN